MDQYYQANYQTSVTVASDGTIFIAKGKHLFELKPNKSPQVVLESSREITDILFLRTNEIIFADDHDDGSILLKKEHYKFQMLYELKENYYKSVLSLCRSRDGNIMILYIITNEPNFLETLLGRPNTFYIDGISPAWI